MKKDRLHPNDQVRIRIEVLDRELPQTSRARYGSLLVEKDSHVLTPKEQAELIALANGEFDTAIARATGIVQKIHPEFFDKKDNLNRQKALTSLRLQRSKKKVATANGRKSKKAAA